MNIPNTDSGERRETARRKILMKIIRSEAKKICDGGGWSGRLLKAVRDLGTPTEEEQLEIEKIAEMFVGDDEENLAIEVLNLLQKLCKTKPKARP